MTPTIAGLLGFACALAFLGGAATLSSGNVVGMIPLTISLVAAYFIGLGQGDDL